LSLVLNRRLYVE